MTLVSGLGSALTCLGKHVAEVKSGEEMTCRNRQRKLMMKGKPGCSCGRDVLSEHGWKQSPPITFRAYLKTAQTELPLVICSMRCQTTNCIAYPCKEVVLEP